MAKKEKTKATKKEAPKKVKKVKPVTPKKEKKPVGKKEAVDPKIIKKVYKFIPDTAVLTKVQPKKEFICTFWIETEEGEKVFRREHIDLLDAPTRKALGI